MPAKSRHGKGKRTTRSKRKVVRAAVDTQSQPQAVSPVAAEARSEAVAAPAGASHRAVVPAMSHPYLAGDLRRTGLLAGVMLVLLLVLYFVLS
jgi:hypothetical protein